MRPRLKQHGQRGYVQVVDMCPLRSTSLRRTMSNVPNRRECDVPRMHRRSAHWPECMIRLLFFKYPIEIVSGPSHFLYNECNHDGSGQWMRPWPIGRPSRGRPPGKSSMGFWHRESGSLGHTGPNGTSRVSESDQPRQ